MNDTPRLIDWLDRLASAHVVCVGDVMLDRFVYGDVDRISPEAPIPVLRIAREAVTVGGAGNVASLHWEPRRACSASWAMTRRGAKRQRSCPSNAQ